MLLLSNTWCHVIWYLYAVVFQRNVLPPSVWMNFLPGYTVSHDWRHAFCNLSNDMSIASSKASSPEHDLVIPLLISSILSFSLRWSNSYLCLLPCCPITSVLPFIFLSIPCCRRQFLHEMWPIELAFLLFTIHKIFLSSLTLCNNSFLTQSIQLIFSTTITSKLLRYFWSTFESVQVWALYKVVLQMWHSTNFSLTSIPICWWKESSVWVLLLLWQS